MNAFFLDVDGVITNKLAEVDERVVKKITNLADSGNLIFLITGRSFKWFETNIISELSRISQNAKNIKFIGEYGAVFGEYSKGKWELTVDKKMAVPRLISEEVKDSIKNMPGIFFDSTKLTMVSVELKHDIAKLDINATVGGLDEAQRTMANIAKRNGLKCVRTTFAVDIVSQDVGKEYATNIAVKKFDVKPELAVGVGDSPEDFGIKEAIKKECANWKFYYVGEKEIDDNEIIITDKKYSDGALSTLSAF
ncbi:MAG: hypothetical protein V1911_02440 [Candidatus Micrarchaeota archaeon]